MINSSRQPSIVGTNPYGDYKAGSMNFESMDKRSLVMNSTIEDNRSFGDVYEHRPAQVAPFGSHLSPGSTNFIDLHGQEVHYAPGGGASTAQHSTMTRPVSNYDGFENQAYRPDNGAVQNQHQLHTEDSQKSLWQAASNQTLTLRGADSVLELKRDLASQIDISKGKDQQQQQAGDDSANTSDSQTTQSTEQEYQTMDQDYQTMDRSFTSPPTTFRPSSAYSHNTSQATLQVHQSDHSIPSVPGYAKPYAHSQAGTINRNDLPSRPNDPPPEPPSSKASTTATRPVSMGAQTANGRTATIGNGRSRGSSVSRQQPLETSLDDDVGAGSSRHVRY